MQRAVYSELSNYRGIRQNGTDTIDELSVASCSSTTYVDRYNSCYSTATSTYACLEQRSVWLLQRCEKL